MGLFKSKPAAPKLQSAPQVPQNGSQKNRVDDTDKAILDVKSRQRKIRTYQDKLKIQDQELTNKIKEQLKAGQKQRAVIILKQKKYVEKEVEKADGAYLMLA